jgi:hypothetical protein
MLQQKGPYGTQLPQVAVYNRVPDLIHCTMQEIYSTAPFKCLILDIAPTVVAKCPLQPHRSGGWPQLYLKSCYTFKRAS